MRYDTRLLEMAKALGFGSGPTTKDVPTPLFSRGTGRNRSMEKYRKHRKIRNKMARESRRRNRA